jgi:hypothetical protein
MPPDASIFMVRRSRFQIRVNRAADFEKRRVPEYNTWCSPKVLGLIFLEIEDT